LERFRAENPKYAEVKMTYAGRLDPMAEGLLVVLVGEECKKKDEYLGLDKEYEFEILFGISTDTYDILGIPKFCDIKNLDFKDFLGKHVQEYPPYSSRTFQMARDGIDFEPPTKEIEIYNMDILETREMRKGKLLSEILDRIDLVKGDFRQTKIKDAWRKLLIDNEGKFKITRMKIRCSSGTYVRSICYKLGGIAYSIKRRKVGEYFL
jgi:tRNA pseudouridine55 synthase